MEAEFRKLTQNVEISTLKLFRKNNNKMAWRLRDKTEQSDSKTSRDLLRSSK